MHYQANEILHSEILHAEQVRNKLPLCFNNSLNSSRDWQSFKFAGKLFQKTFPLNFNKSIPYLWVFASGSKKGTPLISK